MRDHITFHIDDAIELTEILEYLLQWLDILADHHLTHVAFADDSHYGPDDLRADVARLVNQLNTSPHAQRISS